MTIPYLLNDFLIILFSILVEGIPFILLGALLSAVAEVWVSEEKVAQIMPKNLVGKLSTMTLLGNILPVCECGNVPFARRLIIKKIKPFLALTFLLAAPVMNPIVILSTIAAFPGEPGIVLFRILFTVIVAVSVGMLFMKVSDAQMLNKELMKRRKKSDHSHRHGFLDTVGRDLLEMSAIFVFGGIIATSIQLFIPKDFVLAFNNAEWLSILAMMLLGFIVSICSNVDAFFALAYAQVFPTSSILAFLVFGPMIDIKALPMFSTIFSWKTVALISVLCAVITFNLSYLYFLFS